MHTRRAFLADMGMGFTGLALSAMLADDGVVRADAPAAHAPPDGRPHHPPRARSVLWIFLSGGYSHLETFDPKPALNRYAGLSFDRTPFENPVHSPLHRMRFRSVPAEEINVRDVYPIIYPMQVGWKKHGQSGIEMTDWWPRLSACVDDLCFVRNMWTTDNDHAAENQMHTGRHKLDEVQPSVGSWVHYGLGSLNDNLPQFVVLGWPTRPDRPRASRPSRCRTASINRRSAVSPAANTPAAHIEVTITSVPKTVALAGISTCSLRVVAPDGSAGREPGPRPP